MTSTPRPTNRRRASARATGTARMQERIDEQAACTTVNRTAAQSLGPNPTPNSARLATAASASRINDSTISAALNPDFGLIEAPVTATAL
ncbi:hypothetical protein Z949_3494 [Sulfitobacter guttiformis KCTC 32187]|nr:hypothetical protein Z949_3494 [Sulfitobacter guttiformis KCTC 32187]